MGFPQIETPNPHDRESRTLKVLSSPNYAQSILPHYRRTQQPVQPKKACTWMDQLKNFLPGQTYHILRLCRFIDPQSSSERVHLRQAMLHKRCLPFDAFTMVVCEAKMVCISSSLAVMIPIGDELERGHSIASSMSTIEVNFEEMVGEIQHMHKAKSSKLKAARARARRIAKTTQELHPFGVKG
ncbi:uncharacterized protein LOC111412880 isoform X2 [Olea europaea var. sylvestris]|uniref:uncharacterized protein LOC111412880 isoform X2 n=1 Tax=Olea europaea var. sylvestris TaxID=158386 RepID=UPI000C1D8C16|nr:uncharacterized protein LOC111412880 isoform X2 [Olea europaea var. sylvestris]